MIKFIISTILFYIGDWTCKLLHTKLFFNAENKFTFWMVDFYQKCMEWSLDFDDGKVWKLDKTKIPQGPYCYDKNGGCPYYIHSHNHDDICSLLNIDIMDEIKECNFNKTHLKETAPELFEKRTGIKYQNWIQAMAVTKKQNKKKQ